jgi:ABC-type transport system involved in multi-copper enzyme maturation permease subunit
LIPLLVSLAVGLIIILLNPRVGWKGSDWGALGMIAVGAVVYFGLFTCLGIFISSRHQSSSSSIMTSLFIWVLTVLVVPNLSPYLASLLRPTPSRIMINREVQRITQDERDELGRKIQKERTADVLKEYPVLAPVFRMSEQEILGAIKKDPAFAHAYEALRKTIEAVWREANRIQGDKAKVLWEELDRKEKAQTRLSVLLSLSSPLAAFSYLTTDLSNTGLRNEAHFRALSDGWGQAYGDYADNKMEALRKEDPTMDVWNTPVDVSDMPRFQYKEEALTGRIKAVLAPLAVLAVLSILLFGAAYVSFIRYDVR